VERAPEIVIIKKRPSHGRHHGGAWKVAYADFVTAMMALFIVLWLMNSSRKVQEAVGGYFRDPRGAAKGVRAPEAAPGAYVPLKREDMEKLKQELLNSLHRLDPLDKLKDQIEITITAEGLRIDLMESAKGTFFELGSAKPTPALRDVLQVLSQDLGQLPNKISIEGHTDAKPYPGIGGYDNWDLSSDRANGARRLMQHEGVRPDQVSQVRGFSDQRLRIPAHPDDPSNRRVSLIVQYLIANGTELAPSDTVTKLAGLSAGRVF
jgi:chemotaxis protein MotB